MKRLALPGLLAALAVLCGCSSDRAGSDAGFTDLTARQTPAVAMSSTLDPRLLRPPGGMFTLGPGDRIDIELLGQAGSRATTFVGPDGKIYYNLAPGVDVWGLTLDQARQALERELGKYLAQPQIAITLREVASKRVWLLGRLAHPGVYPLAAPTTLLECVALAGGTAHAVAQANTAELADLRHSFVMRNGQFLPVDFYRLLREGDARQNIYLQPDDFVYIASALSQEVFVLGSVHYPRAVPYTEHMTLAGAIAGASGPATVDWLMAQNYAILPDADVAHVALVRGSLTSPQMMVVNYGAIIKGRIPDVPLEPGDIIYVPNVPYATLKRYLNTVVTTFITTVAANQGLAAANGQVSVGVAVPVGR